jgi:hypothetical protein
MYGPSFHASAVTGTGLVSPVGGAGAVDAQPTIERQTRMMNATGRPTFGLPFRPSPGTPEEAGRG